MLIDLLSALALVFVIEGIIPFTSPASSKRVMQLVLTMSDGALRRLGLFSMLLGLGILYITRHQTYF